MGKKKPASQFPPRLYVLMDVEGKNRYYTAGESLEELADAKGDAVGVYDLGYDGILSITAEVQTQ